LSINLAFDEALKDFGYPDIEADLAASRNNLEAQVLLDAAGVFELSFVAQDAVETGKKLLGSELFFVVGARDLEHEQD